MTVSFFTEETIRKSRTGIGEATSRPFMSVARAAVKQDILMAVNERMNRAIVIR
jgi:hypothetical protein